MAISIEELDFDFGHKEDLNTTEKKSCFFESKKTQDKPTKEQDGRILQDKHTALNSPLSNSWDRYEQDSFEFSTEGPSKTSLISRASTAFEKERKIWMGQNAIDQRQCSYTALTAETMTEVLSEQHYRDNVGSRPRNIVAQTCTPQARTHLFKEKKTKVDFVALFSEN